MPTTTRLEVHPIAGALGAELSGVDLGADLDDATIKHLAINDVGPYRRLMRRVQIA